jgi:hypothetical protein
MPADAAAASSPGVSDLQRQIDELAAELRARAADHEAAQAVVAEENACWMKCRRIRVS